jgi:hypothetical protein
MQQRAFDNPKIELRLGHRGPRGGGRPKLEAVRTRNTAAARRARCRSPGCSSPSATTRARSSSAARSTSTTRATCSPSAGRRTPTCAACSPPATWSTTPTARPSRRRHRLHGGAGRRAPPGRHRGRARDRPGRRLDHADPASPGDGESKPDDPRKGHGLPRTSDRRSPGGGLAGPGTRGQGLQPAPEHRDRAPCSSKRRPPRPRGAHWWRP